MVTEEILPSYYRSSEPSSLWGRCSSLLEGIFFVHILCSFSLDLQCIVFMIWKEKSWHCFYSRSWKFNMYVQKILGRELHLTTTGIPGFFSCRTLLVNSELPKGRRKCVHECGSHDSGASPCSLAGHAQTDAQADASHLHQGKDWRFYFFF